MNKFVRNLLTEWRKLDLPFSDETIIVGVSGGADSVSLILALQNLKQRRKLNLNFIVAHFNHNLRGLESEKDAEFVKDLAERLGFEYVGKIQSSNSLIQNQKGNLEQIARDSRYRFFEEVAVEKKAYAILTAHTKNDQAETLLLNLIRGSGLEGLAGMRVSRKLKEKSSDQNEILLVRPLLNWSSREDTESFCRENEVNFRRDSMNEDLKFSRVRIRKEIIPLFKKINPKIIETLAQTANLLRNEAQEHKINIPKTDEFLSQNELRELTKSNLMNILRVWLRKHRGSLRQLEMKHFTAIENLIKSRKSGRYVELPGGEIVKKMNGKIYFEKTRVEKTSSAN